MKKIAILICAAIIVLCAFTSHPRAKSGIFGIIEPMDGAKRVWAISGHDSLSTLPVDGKFSIETKTGTWKISVEAVDANRNASVENVVVLENQFTDVGVIKLP